METTRPTRILKDGRINVYFLAAKEDKEVCLEIKKYLTPIIRNSEVPIEIHGDFDILPGQDLNLYKAKLEESEIVLAFISADFMFDDDIDRRFTKAIERYNAHDTILLQILVRNCMWKSNPYIKLQILPQNGQPLNNKQFWNSEDDALTSVAYDISNAISSFIVKKPAANAGPAMPGPPSADDPNGQNESNDNNGSKKHEFVLQDPYDHGVISQLGRKSYFLRAFIKRGIAYLLDIVLTFIPVYALVFLIYYLGTGERPNCQEVNQLFNPQFWCHFNFYVIPTLALVLICALFEASKRQATFGKMIMKMQTTDLQGNRLSFGESLWRNFLRFLVGGLWVLLIPELIRWWIGDTEEPTLPLILGLSSLILIQIAYFFRTNKIFHDIFTNTVVGEKQGF